MVGVVGMVQGEGDGAQPRPAAGGAGGRSPPRRRSRRAVPEPAPGIKRGKAVHTTGSGTIRLLRGKDGSI